MTTPELISSLRSQNMETQFHILMKFLMEHCKTFENLQTQTMIGEARRLHESMAAHNESIQMIYHRMSEIAFPNPKRQQQKFF